ncbi:hypothetical protein Tco_1053638 [Tanacetum coccineum]|uniref:Uncharacterized protein n=1 Tax=Tanacetum coccineum TaxID=301880 RepID=A0ABQ5GUH0_9ASTR
MPTEMELTLEQTQQGVSYEVSVRINQKSQENSQKRAIHGYENQKSTKRSQRIKAEARKVKPQSNHGQ